MKTRTRTHIAPPPQFRGFRGLVSVLALAAIFLIAAPPAEAQTAGTVTFSATGSGGDRDPTAAGLQVDEGDTVTLTITANGLTAGRVSASWGLAQSGTAVYSDTAMGGDLTANLDSFVLGSRNQFTTIMAPATTAQFTFTITDDTDREDAETIVFSFGADPFESGATPATFTNGPDLTVTIHASDPFVRTLTVTGPATVAEGAAATYTVNLTGTAFTSPTAVTWTVTHGDTAAADFAAVTGSIMFPTATTFTVTPTDDDLDEDAEAFTVQISVADATADSGTGFGNAASGSITDNDEAGLVISRSSLSVPEGETADYTVRLATQPVDATATVTVTISSGDDTVATAAPATLTFTAANWNTPQTVTVTAAATAMVDDAATLTHMVSGMDEYTGVMSVGLAVAIVLADDPAARMVRVKTQLAGFAKSATQLTAQAISRRLQFNGASAFNLGPANEPLRQGAFSLAHGDGGINLWGSGGRLNAAGSDDGVAYDGHTAALHLGADTAWRDGLLGIAIAQSSGDSDFSDALTGNTLKTSLVSVHPYLTRTWRDTKLWAMAGYGTGEAELRENEDVRRRRADADITLLSAGGGLVLAFGDNAAFTAAAHWSRAEIAGATLADVSGNSSHDRLLPKLTASALRLTGGAEVGKRFGDWRPFVTVNLRRDSGDGDDGNAADYGGGVEWQNGDAHLRLAGRKHAQGAGPDEENLTLTARKTAGRLNLGLNLTAASGLNTADLLSGELRF